MFDLKLRGWGLPSVTNKKARPHKTSENVGEDPTEVPNNRAGAYKYPKTVGQGPTKCAQC